MKKEREKSILRHSTRQLITRHRENRGKYKAELASKGGFALPARSVSNLPWVRKPDQVAGRKSSPFGESKNDQVFIRKSSFNDCKRAQAVVRKSYSHHSDPVDYGRFAQQSEIWKKKVVRVLNEWRQYKNSDLSTLIVSEKLSRLAKEYSSANTRGNKSRNVSRNQKYVSNSSPSGDSITVFKEGVTCWGMRNALDCDVNLVLRTLLNIPRFRKEVYSGQNVSIGIDVKQTANTEEQRWTVVFGRKTRSTNFKRF